MGDLDAGYEHLNEAIDTLMASAQEKGYAVLDAVLVVGVQKLDENGQRCGGVGVFMKDGYGPVYTAKGLLTDALDELRADRLLVQRLPRGAGRQLVRHSRPFEAKYPGRCGLCDDDIDPGDEVCYADDEVCHLDCAEDA